MAAGILAFVKTQNVSVQGYLFNSVTCNWKCLQVAILKTCTCRQLIIYKIMSVR